MASAPALPLAGARVAAARSAPARTPAPSLRMRPARAHLLLAVRSPARSVSVRCAAPKTGNLAGAPAPGDDVHGPAQDALMSAAADAFRPLLDNFNQVRSLKNVLDADDYHVGMPFGVLVASIGCYQLFKAAPWAFLDVVLGYALYKLSVVSSQVHSQGFANDFITNIKFAIVIIMLITEAPNIPIALSIISTLVFTIYISTFWFEKIGWKQDARYALYKFVEVVQTKIRSAFFEMPR